MSVSKEIAARGFTGKRQAVLHLTEKNPALAAIGGGGGKPGHPGARVVVVDDMLKHRKFRQSHLRSDGPAGQETRP